MNKVSDRIRAILKGMGYTPATLAIDLEVSRKVAGRLLNGKGDYFLKDFVLISRMLGEDVKLLIFGDLRPGKVKSRRVQRKAEQAEIERQEEQKQAQRNAERKAEQEAWRNRTPMEHCFKAASIALTLLEDIDRLGFSFDDFICELSRQWRQSQEGGNVA